MFGWWKRRRAMRKGLLMLYEAEASAILADIRRQLDRPPHADLATVYLSTQRRPE